MKPTRQNNNINAIKRLESFLMSLKVIFLIKKQRELEKNSIKSKLSTTF